MSTFNHQKPGALGFARQVFKEINGVKRRLLRPFQPELVAQHELGDQIITRKTQTLVFNMTEQAQQNTPQ